MFLILLHACGSNSDKTPENITTIKIPVSLQKLATGNGRLSAYVILDGGSTRISMNINPENGGSASVVLPGLSRTIHNVLITYEYTDEFGSFILAQATDSADLTSGSFDLNVELEKYSLDFDEDKDGITNTKELLDGTDPRDDGLSNTLIVRIIIASAIPKLTEADISGGRLSAYATLDGDIQNRVEMNLDIVTGQVNLTISNLQNRIYPLVVTFEYTDANGTFILAESSQNIDLTAGGKRVNIDVNQFDFISYDDDKDGTYNIDEVIRNSNPSVENIPVAATLNLSYEGVKTFRFSWQDAGSDQIFYQLQENIDGASGFTQVGTNIPSKTQLAEQVVALYARLNSQYLLRSCNQLGCSDSELLNVAGALVGSIGFFKVEQRIGRTIKMDVSGDGRVLAIKRADGDTTLFINEGNGFQEQAVISNPSSSTNGSVFVGKISLSHDGLTLAMFVSDDSTGTGIDSTVSNRFSDYGAVYVFIKVNNSWQQQAYLKASNAGASDNFGIGGVSLSDDGNTLAVGAVNEGSNAVGTDVNIDQTNDLANDSGAVYVFTRSAAGVWRQQAYIKASNTESGDKFSRVSLSGDGLTLAVGAGGEDSNQPGIIAGNGLQIPINNGAIDSGAVYVFTRDQQIDTWNQEAFIKASNAETRDGFGNNLSLNRDGNTLAVSATAEDNGLRNDQNDNASDRSGAVYVFERGISGWVQQDYIKPNVIQSSEAFGSSVSLRGDGSVLAIGAIREKSDAIGLDGDQTDKGFDSGAAFIFERNNNQWTQQVYIKSSNPGVLDLFGNEIKLSSDGSVLAVSASGEDSNAIGINGNQLNNNAENSGAVYLY